MNTEHTNMEEEGMVGGLPFARTRRMAVFGGSFDPIHNGHLQIANYILDKGLADEVLFIPALNPPHKDSGLLAMPMHRMDMLRIALNGREGFSYSDIELRRDGRKSYTYDTMVVLMKIYPDYKMSFVIGMDSLQMLNKWYRAAELVQLVDFIVYPRPDCVMPAYIDLTHAFGPRNAHRLMASVLPEDELQMSPVSSTGIRAGILDGKDMSGMVPPGVWEYIEDNKLYR